MACSLHSCKMAAGLQLSVIMFLLASASMNMVGALAAGRPFAEAMTSSSDQLITEVCSASSLTCDNDNVFKRTPTASDDEAKTASLRDAEIVTINDLQRDFFIESALVEGSLMSLDGNLQDPAPRKAFLTSSAAGTLPALTTNNALAVMKYFGVAHDSSMATAIATAAYLCGSAALPGEARSCAASIDSMATFVAAELGHNIKVYSTSGAPASAPTVKAPVTVVNVAKGSAAEGKKIVVCHHIAFPSMLYYCHRVTGTKVVQATLKQEGYGSTPIKGVGICHINTALWLSRHPAFAALKIARGEEACHWLVENDLVFTPAMSQVVE